MISPFQDKQILVVDDSDDDYETTFRALKKAGIPAENIARCDDGQDALDYLFCTGPYTDLSPLKQPDLILLDLNMPGKDGRKVLSEIKSHHRLGQIPVIMLTTSSDPVDVQECYLSGANSYIRKPIDLDTFYKAIKSMSEYWLDTATLPQGPVND